MKIKDEVDLANVLGMAFSAYANRVQNGAVAPFHGFLKGESEVTVKVLLYSDGSISIVSLDAVKVSTSDLPVLEVPLEEQTVFLPDKAEEPEIEAVEAVEVKPKRKRKTA
jgi:hypothetical protein